MLFIPHFYPIAVYVLGTPRRPIPLNHHLFLTDGSLHQIMDGNAVDTGDTVLGWKSGNYRTAADRLKARLDKRGGAAAYGPQRGASAGRSGGGTTKEDQRVWSLLVSLLQKEQLLPTIVFCFSKKRCEEVAFKGLSSIDLTTAREKAAIHLFMEAAVKRLNGSDRFLPQIVRLRSLLKRGLGVHHSGLLPIMKECVEMLFARGLIKLLFTTVRYSTIVLPQCWCCAFALRPPAAMSLVKYALKVICLSFITKSLYLLLHRRRRSPWASASPRERWSSTGLASTTERVSATSPQESTHKWQGALVDAGAVRHYANSAT